MNETKTRKERVVHSAKEKGQAVLAVWTQRRRPSEVCREMGIQEGVLNHWQQRAMEGMLEALEPRTRSGEDRGPLLEPRLEKLLVRKSQQRDGKLSKLAQRLVKVQQEKEATT